MPYRKNPQLVQLWGARACIQWKCKLALLLAIANCGFILACGPGKTGTGGRSNDSPMKLKQSIPSLEETSISASGKYRGKVPRGSAAYKALQPNYNPDIVFKDEKHGDSRRMTKVMIALQHKGVGMLNEILQKIFNLRRKEKKKTIPETFNFLSFALINNQELFVILTTGKRNNFINLIEWFKKL